MKPTFREWLKENRERYQTAVPGMLISQYIEATLNDLSNLFIDYADEVLARKAEKPEE